LLHSTEALLLRSATPHTPKGVVVEQNRASLAPPLLHSRWSTWSRSERRGNRSGQRTLPLRPCFSPPAQMRIVRNWRGLIDYTRRKLPMELVGNKGLTQPDCRLNERGRRWGLEACERRPPPTASARVAADIESTVRRSRGFYVFSRFTLSVPHSYQTVDWFNNMV